MQDQTRYTAAAFRRELMEMGRSEATVCKYGREVEALLRYLDGRTPTRELMAAYRGQLIGSGRPQTVNGRISAINAYLRFIGREELRLRQLSVQRRAFVDASRELTQSEYRRLLEAAQGRQGEQLRLVVLTICSTGIRVSELCAITAEAVRSGRAEIALKGKARVVLLPKRLRTELARYAQKQGIGKGCVFRTRGQKPLHRGNIWRAMKRLAEKAHVDARKVFPHNLRHLFARTYYEVDRNLAHLADILGHSSVETTRIYVAVSERAHERTLERMRLII